MIDKIKKGIAVIYDPHNLHQFLWFYATYGQEYEWTALCLPNGYKGEYMSQYCRKSGVFAKIISDSEGYLNASWKKKAKEFLLMFYYAMRRKQNIYCRRLINQYVDIDEYDIAVVLTDVGIISGAFIGLGREKQVVILEDGMGDYADRPAGYICKHLFNFYDIQGYLVAKMGYANPAHYYPLKSTRYCQKFSSNPDQMIYKEYKEMLQLFDMEKTNVQLFNRIVERTYEDLKVSDFERAEAIIFTNRLYDFGDSVEPYIKRMEEYVNSHYKCIILKRHPRDETNYKFSQQVEVYEVSSSVPAEVILPYLANMNILFMLTTSIMLYMKAYHYKPTFLYFKGLHEQNLKEKTYLKYITKEEMKEYLNKFDMENSEFIDI